MSEIVRSVCVRLEVDTTKATRRLEAECDSLEEAIQRITEWAEVLES